MPTFKTQQQVYDDVKAYVQTQLPELTSFAEGSPERGLARLVAYALSLAWTLLYKLYQNIWATVADREGLREWYEVFGMTWAGEKETDARAQVLAKFRERALGTAGWYEVTVTEQFPEVTEAHFLAGRRGANTADLLVLHFGGDVMADTIDDIQTYFDAAERKVCTLDLAVITRHDVLAMAETMTEEA